MLGFEYRNKLFPKSHCKYNDICKQTQKIIYPYMGRADKVSSTNNILNKQKHKYFDDKAV